MRTRVVINGELLGEALRLYGGASNRTVVETALRMFVEVKSAPLRRLSYRDRLRQIAGRLEGLQLRESPSELLRAHRDQS